MEENGFDKPKEREEQDVRLSRFMANVSHDLKTPLNAVVGFSSLLLQITEPLPEDASHQLGLIDKNARKLLHRLDAMVEFYRLRAGLVVPQSDWLKPRELLMKLSKEQEEVLRRQKNTLQMDQNSIPSRIRAARVLVVRVLSELVSNAVKYTQDGKIEIGAELEPGSRPGLVKVDFSVLDTGNSLSKGMLAKLSASLGWSPPDEWLVRRTVFDGLGLGLALAREAANLMGGWIEVEGRTRHSSKFSLVLELAENDIEH